MSLWPFYIEESPLSDLKLCTKLFNFENVHPASSELGVITIESLIRVLVNATIPMDGETLHKISHRCSALHITLATQSQPNYLITCLHLMCIHDRILECTHLKRRKKLKGKTLEIITFALASGNFSPTKPSDCWPFFLPSFDFIFCVTKRIIFIIWHKECFEEYFHQ